MKLTPIAQRFILHWGDMGNSWGVNRTVAQIHALLFFHGRPLNAEEIADTLNAARSNVSNSLKELLNWGLIRSSRRPGDRRDYFDTSADVWELLRTIVRERKQREFDPTSQMLRLSPSTLDKVLRLGASVQRFIRSGQPPTAAPKRKR